VIVDLESLVQFSPNQVVCLEQGDLRLFGEVVQMVPERSSLAGWKPSRCWVRPLAMAQVMPESLRLSLLYDLRESSHLVLPAQFFREALDTEVIPIMDALFHPEKEVVIDNSDEARVSMHQLIRMVSVQRSELFQTV
jgi:hypothetical protein